MIVEDPAALPDVPQTEPSHPITDQDLPEVPQTEPSQPITDQQPDVLEPRQPITDQLPDVPSHEPKVSLTCLRYLMQLFCSLLPAVTVVKHPILYLYELCLKVLFENGRFFICINST